MKIFWSWQSDRDPKLHHYFVRDALKEACKLIANDPEYDEAQRPEVDHDTKNVLGTPDITKTILDKIATANVFIADMTPVGMTDPLSIQPNVSADKRSEPKFLQNPNVMSELGYAERAISQDRIILVANSEHYPGPNALPFDWRHRSGAKIYCLKEGSSNEEIKLEKKRFAEVLKDCIKPILESQMHEKAPTPPIPWQATSATDPAIWAAAESGFKFRTNGHGQAIRSISLKPGPRIFARIAPSQWSQPRRIDLENLISDIGIAIRPNNGDWGINSEGAIQIWHQKSDKLEGPEATNATQWFQKTGELWAVSSNSFAYDKGKFVFGYETPFKPLDVFLNKGIKNIINMGGMGKIGIQIGAGDLSGTLIPGNMYSDRSEAVGSFANVQRELEIWTIHDIRNLLFQFWNSLLDAYGFPSASTIEEFERNVGLSPLK